MLADFLTMREHLDKPLEEMTFCYLGDARFNMANSYLVVGAKLGMDVRIAAPKSLWPAQELVDMARASSPSRRGARITITEDVEEAVARLRLPAHRRVGLDGRVRRGVGGADRAADAVPDQRRRRWRATGNPDAKFMHCLPAFHNTDTRSARRSRRSSA